MSPASVVQWLPVVREIIGLGQLIADRVRKRRARRRAWRESKAAK